MRFREVLRYKVAAPFINMLFLANDFYSTAAARGSRLHYIHAFKSFHLTFVEPAFIVFGKNICGRRNIIVLAMCPLHFEDVAPEVVFAAQVPGPGEMVNLLIFLQIIKKLILIGLIINITKPCNAEGSAFSLLEIVMF